MMLSARFAIRAGALVMLATAPASLFGQSRCEPRSRVTSAATVRLWAQPLHRTVTLPPASTSLRDALARVAAAARVRLSYSSELLPLDRQVCSAYDSVAVGDALNELLHGTTLQAVPAGPDHIVLTPSDARPTSTGEEAPPELVIALQPVIAAASPRREPANTHAFAVDVLDGRQLAQQSSGSLVQIINGAVPGLWAWSQSSFSPLAQYGSMRGASSLGMSHPKIYIDGIEVANPLLVTRISPDAIERIEVIRGPQGAALYGADAMGGVTNIVTRHETVGSGAPRARVRSGLGFSASDFVAGSAFAQDHSISLRAGGGARSAGLNLAIGSVGEYMPDAFTRHFGGDGSVRLVGSRTMLTGTLRFFSERTGTSRSPMLTDLLSLAAGRNTPNDSSTQPLSVRQYTAGINARYQPNDRSSYSLVLGLDGYALGGVPGLLTPALAPADSAWRAAGSSGLRATLRVSTTSRFEFGEDALAALTVSAEHSRLGQRAGAEAPSNDLIWAHAKQHPVASVGGKRADEDPVEPAAASLDQTRSNTGLSTQLNAMFLDRVLVSAGVRFERYKGSAVLGRVATLPMLGAAWLIGGGSIEAKLRAAYGKSIRWPDLPNGTGVFRLASTRVTSFMLAPEQQAGVEAGIDLTLARTLRLQLTRFDQLASDLVHRVAITEGSAYARPRITYQLQNVGEIANRGWEVQGSLERGRLTLAGTLSLVDSRVRSLSDGYTGDLSAGDRPLAVPARMSSLSASWTDSRWSATLGAYRAADWINYDRVALARALADSSTPTDELLGAQLRSYWQTYHGFTHLRASTSREFRPGLWLTLSGENLLNYQVGEPDNITVLPGRTISLGIRAAF